MIDPLLVREKKTAERIKVYEDAKARKPKTLVRRGVQVEETYRDRRGYEETADNVYLSAQSLWGISLYANRITNRGTYFLKKLF